MARTERLTAEQKTIERYYRQQEGAVAQIAIGNICLAKQRKILERRHADLTAIDERLSLVRDLGLVGAAMIVAHQG